MKRWLERGNLGSRIPGLVCSFWGKKKSTLAGTGKRGKIAHSNFRITAKGEVQGTDQEVEFGRTWEGGAQGAGGRSGGMREGSQDRSSGH